MLKVPFFFSNSFDIDNQWRLVFLFHSIGIQVIRTNSYQGSGGNLEVLSLFDVNAIMLAIFNYYFGYRI